MADNFDLKKFLKESKALENLNPSLKSINEEESREERANVDKYEYEKGKKAGKREGMKAKIKDMIVAELELNIDNPGKTTDDDDEGLNADYTEKGFSEGENGPAYRGSEGYDDASDSYTDEEDNYDYSNDFYDGDPNDFGDTDEFDGYGGYDLEEAKKKDKVEDVEDVEVTDTEVEDMPAEDEMPAEDAPEATGGIEDIAADMKGTEADLMDHLMKAFQIAKGMQNEKLETQVGNTLKFFVSEYIGGGE
jgi:hypothetical protein